MACYILGLSAFYHDSAAVLLRDGEIIAAAQEERFTRKRHDQDYPRRAVDYCYREAGIESKQLSHIVFYDKPLTKFERLLDTYVATAPRGWRSFAKAIPLWMREKLWTPKLIADQERWRGEVLFAEHHESHAASAFYPSPFREAAIVTMDGVGEWTTTSIAHGIDEKLDFVEELRFPHSLGLLYSAFTYYTGFKVNSGEYKVMGLAPYGEPRFASVILDHLIDLHDDGSFRLNLDYFNFHVGLTMTNERFHRLFGGPPRKPESPLTQREMDLARSIQDVTEQVVERVVRHAVSLTGVRKVCLAGGVALNCVANGKLLRNGVVDDLWIQPAAGDAGGALGAAYSVWHKMLANPRQLPGDGDDLQKGSYLGPRATAQEIRAVLDEAHARYEVVSDDELTGRVAQALADGKIVGWHHGRMEFGPRALGARSILGDPRSEAMQRMMNLKIKFRESFRPFAPAVLEEDTSRYFELSKKSPYMLLVADLRAEHRVAMTEEQQALFGIDKLNVRRSSLPAITHVDYSARLQTVDGKWHRSFYDLIRAFKHLTGCPVLVNTSFNVRGEPIVQSPRDSYLCFMRTEIDLLVIENFLLVKRDQPALDGDQDWRAQYQLD